MGTVYAAADEVLERPVAVKLIREDLRRGPLDLDARFRQEARAAAAFAHPNVVRVYDFGVDRDRRAVPGDGTARGRHAAPAPASAGAPLPAAEALQRSCAGVCSALTAAHGQGLVHRDLKPENIFLAAARRRHRAEGAGLRARQSARVDGR